MNRRTRLDVTTAPAASVPTPTDEPPSIALTVVVMFAQVTTVLVGIATLIGILIGVRG